MYLRQVYDPHLAQYAYVIGCQKTGEAIVIDPLRDVAQYHAIAEAEGLRLSAVAETHIHADFVSGAREFAADGKMAVFLSAEGGPDWQSEWARDLPNTHLLRDGDEFHIGNIKLQAVHTPGHTPEHLCYLVTDEGGGADEPIALVSGDFLFVGDVGRPDLLEQAAGIAGTQEAGASQLYQSLKKLRDMPEHLQILPAHGAGSACGKSLGAVPVSTLGYEKKFNHALKLALNGTEESFVKFILEGQPEPPLYFANMKRVNKLGPAILGEAPAPPRVALTEVSERLTEPGFVVLDARSDRKAFISGHLQGSLYAPAKGDFSGLAGSYLMPEETVVLVVDSEDQVSGLTTQLRRIGFDHIAGWLSANELAKAGWGTLRDVPTVTFSELHELIQGEPTMRILDVRRAGEFAAGHLRGAVNIAHTRLRARSTELAKEAPLVVHCQSGNRAAAAVAWLQREGRRVYFVDDSFKNVPIALLA
ncbi:hydroxyacylglutathione hydrolase [Roseimicrobium gellanilyticum]|uniref:Hydroxyacylglutathione hydrolase n=1 Tax=Roseimicrobium gellanilyticum TaxID=748857 RepID=A0A366H8U2_9BACT|nr:MBL fold metallo-hydrolase [Roseimicrobium gellanilyticum]RBP38189.1 hydroxyacylglutathione hydrolase [Roseimicrobium gellanilyticum]